MTDADRAYEAAEAAIAKAMAEGSTLLYLSSNKYRSLELLPKSISKLSALTLLDLSGTQISDTTPLAGLKSLTSLVLNKTQISDLTPIAGLKELKSLYCEDVPVNDATTFGQFSGLTILRIDGTGIHDAMPLANLTALTGLGLRQTQIRDAAPLAGLTSLKFLYLTNTKISDLRPVLTLSLLAKDPDYSGLSFKGCEATQLDPRIAEIAEIEDNKMRAATLFDYLETWEPPALSGDNAPAPDVLFPVEVEDDRLEVAASSPTQAERDEALKQSMHEALKNLADRLAQAAGNHFPDLAKAARRLEALLDCPFEELDLPQVFLALSDFRSALASGEEERQRFPDKVVSLLDQIMQAGPALTIGNPKVDVMLERARQYAQNPDPEEDRAAQDDMSRIVASDDKAIAPGLIRIEQQVLHLRDEMAAIAQKALNKNVLWMIAAGAAASVGQMAVEGVVWVGGQAVTAYGPAVREFVAANLEVLKNAAATYGPVFLEWFIACASKLQEVAAVIASSERRPK